MTYATIQKFAIFILIACMISSRADAYSVFTHEEIIDMVWNDQLKLLIQKRFPNVTPEQLQEAHAYAYGGAVIQDLGYYPFGNAYFSDLVHYVRSGDFVSNLIADAQDPNEYAFALGALAHYASDLSGHPAVNRSVAIMYPKLEHKYGPVITYYQNKTAHLNTEFGFDVLQVSKQRFNFDQYHSFIGFQVSKPVLERAFKETYGIDLNSVLHEDLAIGTFRWSVSKVIPQMTKVALATRNKEDLHIDERDTAARRKFLYHISRADYEKEFGNKYVRPGTGAKIIAFFFHIVPKIGPFKGLRYKDPTPQTQDLYYKSVDATVDLYRSEIRELMQDGGTQITLANRDFDTGKPTLPGEYGLTDKTHAKLALQLEKAGFPQTPQPLNDYLVHYFQEAKAHPPEHMDKDFRRAAQACANGCAKAASSAAGNSE